MSFVTKIELFTENHQLKLIRIFHTFIIYIRVLIGQKENYEIKKIEAI